MSPLVVAGSATALAAIATALPVRRLVTGDPGAWTSRVAVALLAALAGAGAAVLAEGWLQLVTFAALGLGCAVLVAVDLDCHRLPDVVTIPTAATLVAGLVVVSAQQGQWDPLGRALAAGVVLGLAFLALALISPRSLGLGDVKLAGLLGVFLGWFGWTSVLVGVVATFLLGGLAAVVLLAFARASRSTALAFGPWLVLGAVAAVAVTSAGLTTTP
ncbi:prepilin peptidase [Pseudactinotalea terrae]|uniref:prepilin peptidase n=1 Tax=Pseudactinotalea terrae TaxID=1743262 RepID=UPI001391AED8|nr:A24 family peptidase [Pseudactinotalea terrae]